MMYSASGVIKLENLVYIIVLNVHVLYIQQSPRYTNDLNTADANFPCLSINKSNAYRGIFHLLQFILNNHACLQCKVNI